MRYLVAACFFATAISSIATGAHAQDQHAKAPNTYSGVLKVIVISGTAGKPQSFLIEPSVVADAKQKVCNKPIGHYDAYSFVVPNRSEFEKTPDGKKKAAADQAKAARLLVDAYLTGGTVTLTYRCRTSPPWISSIRTRNGTVSFRVDDLPDS